MAVQTADIQLPSRVREDRHVRLLNKELRLFFQNAVRVTLRDPRQALFFLRTVGWQTAAARTRARWKRQDVHVPPIMIFSITNRCNLHCKGCYAQAIRSTSAPEMSADKMRGVFDEARELGISFAVLAGGEPLVRPEIVDIVRDHPQIIALLFTNGLLIDDEMLGRFTRQRNLVPVISMEGYEEDTDGRRGQGVYGYLQAILPRLREQGIFYAVSLTVTRSNFETITGEPFVRNLLDLGCQMVFYLEYTPIRAGTEDWVITDQQRARIAETMEVYRQKYPALFVSVPGDEDRFSGCLAAGRGFVHISADGNLEACPFAPFSDTNLRDTPLKEALRSRLLHVIREHAQELEETSGGCALWDQKERVYALLAQ